MKRHKLAFPSALPTSASSPPTPPCPAAVPTGSVEIHVIFAEWTAQTGYVIILEHKNDLISVYKHNASLAKEQGELVKAGEVIATAGDTGELSTGPHLHFELWSEGYPIDPENFIDFD